jgi:hypothetical protein
MYGNFQRTYRRVVGIITLCLHTPELGIIALRTHAHTHTHTHIHLYYTGTR